jgi:hypothetical protein
MSTEAGGEVSPLYLFATWGLMVVIPATITGAELALFQSSDPVWVIAKWFVFWGIGVRLFTAGIRQVLQPGFTARSIFGISDPQAEKLVSEIGFANLALGSVAVLSLIFPQLVVAIGLAGGIFLGLDGFKHISNGRLGGKEKTAMVTDLVSAAIALASAVLLLVR